MNAQIELIEGTNRDHSKSQFFTPPKLAAKVVQWAGVGPVWNDLKHPNLPSKVGMRLERPMRVLEPSAGNGALVRPLAAAGAWVTAVELDGRYTADLQAAGAQDRWSGQDFLAVDRAPAFEFDLCVMNPPYHDDGESKFILHALKFAPRVVGIFRADVFYTVSRGEALWKHVRPTRVAFCSRRPWKGAETDYCVLELVKRMCCSSGCEKCRAWPAALEWWEDSW